MRLVFCAQVKLILENLRRRAWPRSLGGQSRLPFEGIADVPVGLHASMGGVFRFWCAIRVVVSMSEGADFSLACGLVAVRSWRGWGRWVGRMPGVHSAGHEAVWSRCRPRVPRFACILPLVCVLKWESHMRQYARI
jgi:hypothetical protein